MNKIIAVIALAVTMTAGAAPDHSGNGAGAASQAPAEAPLTLEAAISTALAESPGLKAIRARAEAMARVPEQQGTLPDPRLSFGVANLPTDSFAISQEAMTQLQVGISQTMPYPGKLTLMSQVAEGGARMAGYDVDEWRLSMVGDIRTLWWRLAYLDRAIGIVAANRDLLRQFVRIAQTKYRVGSGLQQDVLLAQLELSQLIDRDLQLNNERQSAAARLNALMGVAVERPVILPAQVDEDLPEVPSLNALLDQARNARPAFKRQTAAIDQAKDRMDLARKDYYPDLQFSAAYGLRSGANPDNSARSDLLSLGVSINLPIFASSRQDPQLDQRRAEWMAQRFEEQDLEQRVGSEVAVAYQDYQRRREQARLFNQGVIPQATQTVASMRSGYEVNKVDFLNLIRAQITLFNYQIGYWQTLSEAHAALARLNAAIGKESL